MTTRTVAVFNATGGSNRTDVGRFGTWYDDLECDVAIVSEVFRFANVLRHCGHLRVGADNHGREDCGVITKRKVRRWSQRRVTRFIDRPGSDKPLLWHDRWITRVVAGPRRDRIVALSSHARRGYGHRAISLGDGKIRSTDMTAAGYKPGVVGTTTIAQIESSMGVTYTGWSETISGDEIPNPQPLPEPLDKSQRVKVIRRAARRANEAGHPNWAARLNRWADQLEKRAKS